MQTFFVNAGFAFNHASYIPLFDLFFRKRIKKNVRNCWQNGPKDCFWWWIPQFVKL